MGFVPVAVFRYRMAVSNAQRLMPLEPLSAHPGSPSDSATLEQQTGQTSRSTGSSQAPAPVQTVLRPSFVTAGSVVAAATAFVGLAEIALLVLILRL